MRAADVIERGILVLVAVLAAGWLAVSLSDFRAIEHAEATAKRQSASPAELQAALDDAERADRLRPSDTAPAIARAPLLSRLGRERDAVDLMDDVVRQEPDNLRAVFVLTIIAFRPDPDRSAAARKRLGELDPIRAGR